MKILRVIGIGIGLLLLVLAGFSITARLSDGPIAAFAGGPFTSGEVVDVIPASGAFLRDRPTIEFQLEEPPRSRTAWILYHDGELYIPCGIPWFRIWKQWPHEALKDGRMRLRVDGSIFDRKLVLLDNPPLHETLRKMLFDKYRVEVPDPDSLWFFRIAKRG